MMPTSSEAEIDQLFVELFSQKGVQGSCLLARRSVIRHDLPCSDERIHDFAARLDHFIASYEGVGRQIWQLCAGFEKFWLLILCREDLRLGLLLEPGADTATIAGRVTHLLMSIETVAEPESPRPAAASAPAHPASANGSIPRAKLESMLASLLGRVMGSAQAARLISKAMAGSPVAESFSAEQARRLAASVLETIPNRAKREALLSECLNSL
ncbi:MAG: hypothetical protein N2322_01610 [Terrimicrobiaceae bacterium]|nr:hypothetical protein [Terrimicrobiaceae bacterium]